VLMNTGSKLIKSEHGLLSTIAFAWKEEGYDDLRVTYALEGSVYSAGSTVQWLRDGLHLVRDVAEVEDLAKKVDDNGGVYLVPAFNGLGAPHWNSDARGIITGLTQGATAPHFARAALESTAFQVCDVIRAMEEDAKVEVSELRVDGGASKNEFLMQMQADLLDVEVVRPNILEATALGAAMCAGISAGFWTEMDELREIIRRNNTSITPSGDAEKNEKLKEGWAHAIRQTQAP